MATATRPAIGERSARGVRVVAWTRFLWLIPLAAITLVLLGPFIWTLMMSFRLTNEIAGACVKFTSC